MDYDDSECFHHDCECCCRMIEAKLNAILQLLVSIQTGKAVDLEIVFGLASPKPTKGNGTMSNKKATGSPVKCPCLAPKDGAKKAVGVEGTLQK